MTTGQGKRRAFSRGPNPGRHRNRNAEHHAAFLLPYLSPGMSVLDCGSGQGSITAGLAARVNPGVVTGLDIDVDRVEEAEMHAREAGVSNLRFRVGDAYSLPFPDESFDVVFEHCLLMHLRHPIEVVREAMRVLKPGGIFAARDHDHERDVGSRMADLATSRDLMDLWHASMGSDMWFGKHLPGVLVQAGFRDVRVSASFDAFSSPEEVWVLREGWTREQRKPAFVDWVMSQGFMDGEDVDSLPRSVEDWGEEPAAYWACCGVEALGWKA